MLRKLALALVITSMVGLSGPASAKDMNGKFGVGLSQSLTSSLPGNGVTGIGLNYWIGNLKLGTIFGMNFYFPDAGDVRSTVLIAVQALYAIARADDVNLNFGLRFNMGIDAGAPATPPATGTADTLFGVQFDIPIEGEYFLSEHFSLYGHVGVTLTIIGTDGNPLMPGTPKGFNLGIGQGGFAGGAGFNFYF